MIDIVTKSGKRIGRIADSLEENDTIVVSGREISLSDAYSSDDIREKFNKELRELNNDRTKDSTGT